MSFLFWTDSTGVVQGLTWDIATKEDYASKAEPTTKPVEVGAPITDHLRSEPQKISLDIFVSNTPLNAVNNVFRRFPRISANGPIQIAVPFKDPGIATSWQYDEINNKLTAQITPAVEGSTLVNATGLQFPVEFNACEETLNVLQQLQDNATLVTCVSRDFYLENMVVDNISEPRDVEDGTGSKFTIGLTVIRIVQTQQTLAPVDPRNAGGVSGGSKNGSKPGNPAPVADSVSVWLGKAAGWLS